MSWFRKINIFSQFLKKIPRKTRNVIQITKNTPQSVNGTRIHRYISSLLCKCWIFIRICAHRLQLLRTCDMIAQCTHSRRKQNILNQNYRANNQIGTSREAATLMLAVAVMSWIKHTNRYYYKHVAIAYTVQCHSIRTLSRATCIKIWKNTLQQFVCLVVLPNRQPPPQLTNVAIILMRIKRPLCIWTSIQLTARRVSMMKLSLLVVAAVITVAVGIIPTEFEVPGDNFSCRAKTCADIGTEESNLLCLVVSNFF